MRHGVIVLCGGRSSRMGRDKASLPFGAETLLTRVVRLLCEVVSPAEIAIVAAAEQELPALPQGVMVVRDAREYRGPLEGLANGLRSMEGRIEAAYATACDVPLLVPAFVERMFALLEDYDVAVPRDGEFHHPLAAVYRPTVLPQIERLLSADRLRPRFLFDEVRTREVPVDELRCVDPELHTLWNLNTPDDYAAALATAGLGAYSAARGG